ncbi:hypothetical protein MCAMS1_01185 [biofilm metagenome]
MNDDYELMGTAMLIHNIKTNNIKTIRSIEEKPGLYFIEIMLNSSDQRIYRYGSGRQKERGQYRLFKTFVGMCNFYKERGIKKIEVHFLTEPIGDK